MLQRRAQDDFSVGVERDVAPHLIDPRGCFNVIDGLFNDDGSIYRRGGSVSQSSAPFGSTLRGVWDGWLQPGRRTLVASSSAFGVLSSDDKTFVSLGGAGFPGIPKAARELEGLLFIGGGTIYGGSRKAADYAAGTITVTNGSRTITGAGTKFLANVDVGMLLRLATGRIYVVSSVDSDTQLIIRDLYEGKTEAGVAYTLKRLEAATEPYKSSDFYSVCARRLIVPQGQEVWMSESGKPHEFQATIQPAGVKVNNTHSIDEGVQILGSKSLGPERELIFTTHGITTISNLAKAIVDGLGNQLHRIDKLSDDIVLWGNSGITGWRDALVVPGTEDVYVLDGTSEPQPISRSIRPLYRAYVAAGYTVGQAHVYRDHYFLPILDSSGTSIDTLCCRLDRPTTVRGQRIWPWSFLRGAGGKIAAVEVRAPQVAGDAPKLLAASADGRLLNISRFFVPGAEVKNDHDGTTPHFELITRDYSAESGAIVRWRILRVRYELEAAEGDEPRLYADIGSGLRLVGLPQWDEVKWDEFKWSDEAGIEFVEMVAEEGAPPNAGLDDTVLAQNAWEWYSADRLRHARYRLRTSDPVAKLTIRSIEAFHAPTGGVRHSKVV
jgi:hypothetical protein